MKKLLLLLCIVFYSNELFSAAADPYEPLTYEQVEAFFATPPEESGAAANPTPVSSHISSEDEMLTALIEYAYYDEDLEKRLLKIQSLEESDQELTERQKAQIRELYQEHLESLQALLVDPAFLLAIDPSLLEMQPIAPTQIVEEVVPAPVAVIKAQAARDARRKAQTAKEHSARSTAADQRRGIHSEEEESEEEKKARLKKEQQLESGRLAQQRYQAKFKLLVAQKDPGALARLRKKQEQTKASKERARERRQQELASEKHG